MTQRRERIVPGPIYSEETIEALEALAKNLRPLRRDVELVYRKVEEAEGRALASVRFASGLDRIAYEKLVKGQTQALRVPLGRLMGQMQAFEEPKAKLEALIRELRKRVAWVKEAQKRAARSEEDASWSGLTAEEFLAGYGESDSVYDRI